jgi:hypothetical protein
VIALVVFEEYFRASLRALSRRRTTSWPQARWKADCEAVSEDACS